MKRFSNVTLNKMPVLMKPIEKIDMDHLRDKLSALGDEGAAWEDDEQIAISWSIVMGTFLVVAIGGVIIWKIKSRRRLANDSLVSMQQLEREMPSGVPHSDRTGEEIAGRPMEEAGVRPPRAAEKPPTAERKTLTKKNKP